MITVARVLTFLAGAAVVGATLASAVKTVVVPRAESSLLQRWVFVTLRKPFDWRIDRAGDWEAADRIMARFAPFALILLPGVWVACVLVGFAGIHWAMEADGWDRAFEVSGSSLLTLGFAFDHGRASVVATFVEATIGLGLIALLISFLPTIYQQFSRREVLVSHLAARGGTPPTPWPCSAVPSRSAGSTSWRGSGPNGSTGSRRSRSRTPRTWRSRSSAAPTRRGRG